MESEDRLVLSFIDAHLEDAARLIEERDLSDALQILAPLPGEGIAPVLESLQPYTAARLLKGLPRAQALDVTRRLHASALLGLLRQLSPEDRTPVLETLDRAQGEVLRRALTYPERSAGSLADPGGLTFPSELSVGEALDRVRREPQLAHGYLYVLDQEARLTGVFSLKELIAASPHERLMSLMEPNVVALPAEAREEALISHPAWRRFYRLPVVDDSRGFIGTLARRSIAWLEGVPRQEESLGVTIPEILIQLWEASALVGLRLFTDLARVKEPDAPSARKRGGKK